MLWDDGSEWLEAFEREVDAIFEEAYSSSISWLYDLDQAALKPLYRVEMRRNELLVLMDLPGVDRKDVKVQLTSVELEVDAQMSRPVMIMVGGTFQRSVSFQRFHGHVRLPWKVDPDRARARMRNGWLQIRVPVVPENRPD